MCKEWKQPSFNPFYSENKEEIQIEDQLAFGGTLF